MMFELSSSVCKKKKTFMANYILSEPREESASMGFANFLEISLLFMVKRFKEKRGSLRDLKFWNHLTQSSLALGFR